MQEERKLVTVLFADVVGSTTIGSENDPEVVRSVMARYFKRMQDIAESHGGTVEKFIGDAVMVVFGVPRLHDDDAERGVRAGLAMQGAMAELNHELEVSLALRVGINTGEAVTGIGEGDQFLVTGDTVNVAARLQQGTAPGEVTAGALTEKLTRLVIEYGPAEDMTVAGKPAPLTVFRAVRARNQLPEQVRGLAGMRAPLVGRERERRLLSDIFARVTEERRAHLFTILGSAGVGKSRLAEEVLAELRERHQARVLVGRCLPYGQGITYWPLGEILREDAGISSQDAREAALAKLGARVDRLIRVEAERRSVTARLAVVLGLRTPAAAIPDVPAPRVEGELAWAARRYLEAVALETDVDGAGRGAVVVFDDLQWAEPPLVELIEQTADRVSEAPLFLICIARRELLETNPSWGAGKQNATLISLGPLSQDDTATLIADLLAKELPRAFRDRIVERAEGNPLFCEEFLRMLIDDGVLVREDAGWQFSGEAADVRVPESINALIGARLDGLPAGEKAALQAASVVGERFNLQQVRMLMDSEETFNDLEGLARKGIMVEDRSNADLAGMRFKHLLIRDVAYASLPKSERAELHERFALHLMEELGDRRDEYLEFLAHHAERSFTLSRELRLAGEKLERRSELALRWALRLGERAVELDDSEVLAGALEQAEAASRALPDEGHGAARSHLDLLRAEQLRHRGSYEDALGCASRAAETALNAGDKRLAASAELSAARINSVYGSEEGMRRHALEAERLFKEAGDEAGELKAQWVVTSLLFGAGELAQSITLGGNLRDRATAMGDRATAARIMVGLSWSSMHAGFSAAARGHADEASLIAEELGLRSVSLSTAGFMAVLERLVGNLDAAEAYARRALAAAEDIGYPQQEILSRRFLADVLIEKRELEEAESQLEHALTLSERSGERFSRCELHASRARVALLKKDLALASRFAQRAVGTVSGGDVHAYVVAYLTVGAVRAAEGRMAEAEQAFVAALEVVRKTEYGYLAADAAIQFAAFLNEGGRSHEAVQLLDQAEAWLEERGYGFRRQQIADLRRVPA